MTSKNSFFNILKLSFGQRLWGLAINCILFFFAFPVYAAIQVDIINERVNRQLNLFGMQRELFARDVLGEGNYFVFFAVAVAAIYLGITGFSYLYSKSKVDLIHSLPIKRQELFIVQYVSGLVTFIVPYLAFMILTFIVGSVNGMMSLRGFTTAFIMILINLIGFMGIYNTCIIAVLLTGTYMVGIMASFILLLYGTAITLLRYAYEMMFFITRSTYTGNNMVKFSSPLVAYFNLTDGMNSFTGNIELSGGKIALYILYAVLTLIISIVIIKKRPMEATGKSVVFNKLMPVISVVLLIPIALTGGLFFNGFASNGIHFSLGWFVFGFLAALLIGHFVIQAIYYQDFKSLLKNLYNPAIAGVIAAVVAVIYICDLSGYDTYIPKDSEYESAAIASYALQGNVQSYNLDARIDEFGNKFIDVDLLNYRLDNMKITDKALVRDFAKAGIEGALSIKNMTWEDGVSEEDYYSARSRYAYVTVKYNMANGKEVYRDYTIDLAGDMELYNRLYTNEEYKYIVCPMMQLDANSVTDIRYMGMFGDEGIRFSSDDMKNIVRAYQADVKEQDAYSLKNEVPFGYIYQYYVDKNNGYANNFETHKAYIYPSFKRTMDILNKYNVVTDYGKDIDNIASVEVFDYSGLKPDGATPSQKFTNPEDIKAIMDASVSNDAMSVESYLTEVEDIGVNVNFKNTPYGYSMVVYYNILKGKTPECVTKAFK